MKKRLSIIIGIVVVLFVVSLIVGFVVKSLQKNDDSLEYSDDDIATHMLTIFTKDEMENLKEQYDVSPEVFEDKYYFNNIDCFKSKFHFSYLFDIDDNLSELSAYTELKNTDNLQEAAINLVNEFSQFFGVENSNNYYIYSDDSILDITEKESYNKISNGEATLEFRIRDALDSFWLLKIQRVNANVVLCSIDRFVNNEYYSDMVANIDLT